MHYSMNNHYYTGGYFSTMTQVHEWVFCWGILELQKDGIDPKAYPPPPLKEPKSIPSVQWKCLLGSKLFIFSRQRKHFWLLLFFVRRGWGEGVEVYEYNWVAGQLKYNNTITNKKRIAFFR